jgi:hypothetical protein
MQRRELDRSASLGLDGHIFPYNLLAVLFFEMQAL